jgi:hypothetical protein
MAALVYFLKGSFITACAIAFLMAATNKRTE